MDPTPRRTRRHRTEGLTIKLRGSRGVAYTRPSTGSGKRRTGVNAVYEDELASLRFHWGGAHSITVHLGTWIAVRADSREALTATSAQELLERIRSDYRPRLVPRE